MIAGGILHMGWGSKTESPAWLAMVTGTSGVSLSARVAARVAGVDGVITAWMVTGLSHFWAADCCGAIRAGRVIATRRASWVQDR